ncbi:MAG: glycoside hydrolase family 31 protein [Bacteroidetes bacterium]|nr:glycoside hydrolase family 31 protein [Bacteroidota bacterium]
MKKRLSFLVMFGLVILMHGSFAQVTNIGKVISWKKITSGIEGRSERAFFRIQIYDPNIIRVRVSLSQIMPEFSYVLPDLMSFPKAQFDLSESNNQIEIRTSAIDLTIEKQPAFRLIFRNKSGKIISEDVAGQGFGTSFIGLRSTLYKKMQPGERFVGLGEVLGNLDKRGNAYTLNNTDTYKYGDPRLSMYCSIPFYIGIHEKEVYGIYYNNTHKTFFNFGLSTPGFTSITSEGGDADYFMIYDSDIPGILFHYTSLTGRMPLPPLWSLGYHQSRCSYYPQDKVEWLAKTFRQKKLPVDCIVLDADYLKDYEPFRINSLRFPDMIGLSARLKDMGIELTASVNPGIKVDTTYNAYLDGLQKDVFIKYSDGSNYTADIAPSLDNFVDFTNPKARNWWINNMKFLPDHGIHGYWNDMNEPAVGGSYLPDNLSFDFDGRKANALEAKNLYGMLMARSSYESGLKFEQGKRPFVLTRSGFAGVQRYAAVWTGDNTARDEYLPGGVLLNIQMGISGVPFVGDDIGGYIGNTSPELFSRWMEVGMFAPYARNHKQAYSHSNEPWSYGEESEAISREYLGFRYRMLPYLYSAFYEASTTGIPVARSLCITDPFDDKVYEPSFQSQFTCGRAFMVVPVTSIETRKSVYLPKGDWYDLYTEEKLNGCQTISSPCPIYQIPVFVRASSIIPMQSLVQSTKEKPSDTLIVHIYFGNEKSTFIYYEDDGESFGFKEGKYFKRNIAFNPEDHSLLFSKAEGNYQSKFPVTECIFHGFPAGMDSISVNGQLVNERNLKLKLIDGLKYLDEVYDVSSYERLRMAETSVYQKSVIIQNSPEEIHINWN